MALEPCQSLVGGQHPWRALSPCNAPDHADSLRTLAQCHAAFLAEKMDANSYAPRDGDCLDYGHDTDRSHRENNDDRARTVSDRGRRSFDDASWYDVDTCANYIGVSGDGDDDDDDDDGDELVLSDQGWRFAVTASRTASRAMRMRQDAQTMARPMNEWLRGARSTIVMCEAKASARPSQARAAARARLRPAVASAAKPCSVRVPSAARMSGAKSKSAASVVVRVGDVVAADAHDSTHTAVAVAAVVVSDYAPKAREPPTNTKATATNVEAATTMLCDTVEIAANGKTVGPVGAGISSGMSHPMVLGKRRRQVENQSVREMQNNSTPPSRGYARERMDDDERPVKLTVREPSPRSRRHRACEPTKSRSTCARTAYTYSRQHFEALFADTRSAVWCHVGRGT